MDAYVVELIGTQRKTFEIARGITQEEAARQKQYYDHKASSVNVGDIVLVCNDHHIGCQKLKDHWRDDTYQVISHVDEDVRVYVIKKKNEVEGKHFTAIACFLLAGHIQS